MSNREFRPRFIGPLRIVKRIGTQAYQLLPPALAKVPDVVHVSLLHKCVLGGEGVGTGQPIELDGSLEWEVDAILRHRFNCSLKKKQYLVRFRGFDEGEV